MLGDTDTDGIRDVVTLALMLADDPKVADTVFDAVREDVSDTDGVKLNEPVFDMEPLRLPVIETDGVQLIDMDDDDDAPNVCDTVDVAVCVAVTVLEGVIEMEMLYEGDGAHHDGNVG